MFARILHPTDFSETAFQAFGYAVALSKRHRAELELLHVLRTHDYAMAELERGHALLDEAYERIERSLEERAPELLAGHSEEQPWANMIFRRGYSVTEEIVLEADAREIELIVMGTHGHSQVRRFFLGSVAENVVRYAPCPVLVCGRGGRAPQRFERILVPVDFSEGSRRAAELALELAHEDGAAVQLLHVVEDRPRPAYVDDASPPAEEAALRQAALGELERFAAGLDAGEIEISWRVTVGRPSRVISDRAEENGFDLIAMGTSGLRGISRFLLGSTPARVMRRCSVPVLAVHAHEEKDEGDSERAD